MRRIWVVGTSGSGKSTLAAAVRGRTGGRWIELDGLFHQPGWTPLPRAEFRAAVAEALAGDDWVVDGNYTRAIGDLVLARADAVVSLELPRRTVMCRVTRRTARRVLTRQELWNGNRERLGAVLSRDRERSILRWAWTTHGDGPGRLAAIRADPAHRGVRIIRLRSRREVRRFLTGLTGPVGTGFDGGTGAADVTGR